MYSGMSARLDQIDPFEQMESDAGSLHVMLSDFALLNYKREPDSYLLMVTCQVEMANCSDESIEIQYGKWLFKKTLDQYEMLEDRHLINYRPKLQPKERYVYGLEFETQVPTGLLQGFYRIRSADEYLKVKTEPFQYALPFMMN